jgi:AcrR family transcriptional regulator
MDVPAPPWERRRKPARAREPLTREAIVDAAIRVLDRDGIDGMSMRRVADELGTGAASLYWHVRNKGELLNLLVDRVAGEVELPPPDPERWQVQLKETGREMRRVLNTHRDLARATLGLIPVGPNTLAFGEWLLALLRGAGLPDRVAARAADVLSLYVGAFAFEESLGLVSPTGEDLPPQEILALIKDYWASLPPERFPHTLAVLDELFAGDLDERFEFGLEVLVSGLAAQAR